jgi:hypothetical protein
VCEVAPGLFLGNIQDAMAWTGPRLCVLEGWPGYWADYPPQNPRRPGVDANIPIFNGHEANVEALDKCVAWIDAHLAKGHKCFLHCGQGIERSPLTAAWYLYRKSGGSWEEAYAHVCRMRPQTQRRDHWIPSAARGLAPKGAA